jgi:hypothetical protein
MNEGQLELGQRGGFKVIDGGSSEADAELRAAWADVLDGVQQGMARLNRFHPELDRFRRLEALAAECAQRQTRAPARTGRLS